MENFKGGEDGVESKKIVGDSSTANKVILYITIAFAVFFSNSLSLPEFTQPKDRYSISPSEGWVEMTKEHLDEQSRIASQLGSRAISYSSGYVLKEYKGTSTYPYILVQDRDGDVKNYQAWKQSFKTEEVSMNKEIDKLAEKNSEIMSNPGVADYFFDPDKYYVGMNLDMDVSGEGAIRAQTVIFLGRKQSTQVSLYVKKDELEIYDPGFKAMLNSLQYNPGYEYDENGANSGKPDPYRYLYAGLKGALVGLLVGFLFKYFGKKTRRAEQSTPDPS